MATWSFMSDDGWQVYDKEMNTLLETEFNKGSKLVRVDKDRFVDLSRSRPEVCLCPLRHKQNS